VFVFLVMWCCPYHGGMGCGRGCPGGGHGGGHVAMAVRAAEELRQEQQLRLETLQDTLP
jgi:hypothetical protein